MQLLLTEATASAGTYGNARKAQEREGEPLLRAVFLHSAYPLLTLGLFLGVCAGWRSGNSLCGWKN